MKRLLSITLSLFLVWSVQTSFAPAAFAQLTQPNLIPVIESAESVFATAIQAYEDQDYETAARLFGVVANTFDMPQQNNCCAPDAGQVAVHAWRCRSGCAGAARFHLNLPYKPVYTRCRARNPVGYVGAGPQSCRSSHFQTWRGPAAKRRCLRAHAANV